MARRPMTIALAFTAAAALVAGCTANADGGTATDDGQVGDQQPATPDPAVTPDGAAQDTADDDAAGAAGQAADRDWPSWTPQQLATLSDDRDDLTAPVIDQALAEDRLFEDYWLWDWWPIRDRQGEVADFDGTQVLVGLTADADILPGQRHDVATLRYAVTQDGGQTWTEGGEVFEPGTALGSRQWAGSTMYDDETGQVHVFYTAAGEDGEDTTVEPARGPDAPSGDDGTDNGTDNGTDDDANGAQDDAEDAPYGGSAGGDYAGRDDISYQQRMAHAAGSIETDGDTVRFLDWGEHTIILEPDEQWYASTEGTEGGAGQIDAFRDPWFFQDPATGDEYLLFTATLADPTCDTDGVVGVARGTSPDDLTAWELEAPLLDADCVNDELERPFFVMGDDGEYYLLFTTHTHTFAPALSGPEGLYGFVADEFRGDYRPLNGSGLVLGNPEEEPFQAYSWMVLPNGYATSFFQYFDLDVGVNLDYVGTQDPDYQFDRFAGTVAPSVQIEFDGDTTRVVAEDAPGALGTTS